MLSMWARLGLDSSGFNRGLASVASKTEATFAKVGAKSSKQLQKRLLGTFSLFGAAGFATAGINRVTGEAREDVQAATKAGLDIDTFKAAKDVVESLGDTSRLTAEEFAALVEETKALNRSTQAEALARAQTADALRTFKLTVVDAALSNLAESAVVAADRIGRGMAAVMDLKALDKNTPNLKAFDEEQQKIKEHLDHMSRIRGWLLEQTTKVDLDALDKLRGIDKDDKKEKAEKLVTTKAKETPEAKIVTDAMARLGLFVGRTGAAPHVIEKQQLDELQGLRRDMKDLTRTVKDAI